MPCPSRRSVLQTATTGIGLLGTGCLSSKTDEGATPSWTVDERVDTTPPGAPALEATGEWPSYRFDARNTGANSDGTGVRNGTEYWRLNAGGPATIADGTLYNIASRDRETKTLTYRDPATASIKTSSNLVEYGVSHPPVVGDGRVFVTTYVEVFCFDAQNGEQQWRGPAMNGIQGRPTVHEGRVFVNSGGSGDVRPQLRAFEAASGDELWHYDTGDETKSTPAVDEGRVFISSAGGLHALDLASGEEEYVVDTVAEPWATPVVNEGAVYTVGAVESGYELVALDTANGTARWRVNVETTAPPVVTGEVVYALTGEGLTALDNADGTVLSSTPREVRPMGLVGDVLYAAGDGTVYALDTANELESLWSLRTAEVQISDTVGRHVYHVTPVNGAVYVSARDAFYGIGPGKE